MAANQIVTVNVSQTLAPALLTLQRTGYIVSVGGTTLAANGTKLLTQVADLTGSQPVALSNASLAWAGSVVTVTTAVAHGLTNGAQILITIAGVTPAGYNGTYLATITGASTFTYALASNPGAQTVAGTWILQSVAEVAAAVSTFFAQGTQNTVTVLELGASDTPTAVTNLGTWLTANVNVAYSLLVPKVFGANAAFLNLASTFTATNAMQYFFVTATLATYASISAKLAKSMFTLVEDVTAPTTEFSCAAPFAVSLSYNPSPSAQVTPLSFAYVYGVTALNVPQATISAIKAANVNYIGNTAEGGLTNVAIFWGTMGDTQPFTYWYSVDWVQSNLHLALANAVINGSNNPLAPLLYNQNGINVLAAKAAQVLQSASTFGLATGAVQKTQLDPTTFSTNLSQGVYKGFSVMNAVPFATYTTLSPSDYAAGKYAGLSAVYTPQRGFLSIVFNLNVSSFA